ncbi:response regulator, partial [Acinetobacter baumannii]
EEKATVLIVEDDRALRSGLRWALADGYAVLEAETRHEALEKLEREAVDVVICDLHLPPATESIQEGLVIVEAAKQKRPPVPTVVIT